MKKYFIIAATALALAACSNNEEVEGPDSTMVPVNFSASVGTSVSRAIDQKWSANDAIGIYMVKGGQALNENNISEGAKNIRYIVDASKENGFAPNGTTIYYPIDNSTVDFYAYYPCGTMSSLTTYSSVISGYGYGINVATQSNQEAIDFMYSNNVKGKKKTDKAVALMFSHKLCKMLLTIAPGEGITTANLSGLTVTVKSQNTTQTFNLSTGALMNDAAGPQDITFRKISDTQYEAILLPSASTSRTFEFNLNNGKDAPFAWVMDKALTPGNKYTYTVTINRNGVEATGQILAWTIIDGSNVSAE